MSLFSTPQEKRVRDEEYERTIYKLTLIARKRRNKGGMVFTTEQAAAIALNSLKVSADGSINTHNDVETVSPAIGDLLAWDGVNWVNVPATVGITPSQASDIINNNTKVSADGTIATHSDVGITSPVIGDLMEWDGTNWVNKSKPLLITTDGSETTGPPTYNYQGTYVGSATGTALYHYRRDTQVLATPLTSGLQTTTFLSPTFFYTAKPNQEILITCTLSYERREPGSFIVVINNVETGSAATFTGAIHGCAPQSTAIGLQCTTFTIRTVIANVAPLGSPNVLRVSLRTNGPGPTGLADIYLNRSIANTERGVSSVTITAIN
jgi:hypothetical protein